MMGKFLVFAFVCVSFAQAVELEEAIQEGLLRAKALDETGQKRIEMAEFDVMSKTKLIQATADETNVKARADQEATNEAIRKIAQDVEDRARESNKPDAVFSCIRRNVENADSQIEILTNRLEIDLERLEKTKLQNINTASKPYDDMPNSLTVRYQRAMSLIKGCKNPGCVQIAVNSFYTWLNGLFDNIRRIEAQIFKATSNFQTDAANYYENTNRQVSRIGSTSERKIQECFYERAAIF